MKKKIKVLLLLWVIGIGSFGGALLVGANAGGQVVNDGEITFYEESTTSSTSSTSSSSSSTSSSSNDTLPNTQGGGKLPQTGETIRNVSVLGGVLLLVVLLILLYRRKKKEGDT
ncbi:LPXTG cell wall anchor domain-containing protein [Enterococcus sp. LJL120]